jgi:hypothetical protein
MTPGGHWGLPSGTCVMSIEPADTASLSGGLAAVAASSCRDAGNGVCASCPTTHLMTLNSVFLVKP